MLKSCAGSWYSGKAEFGGAIKRGAGGSAEQTAGFQVLCQFFHFLQREQVGADGHLPVPGPEVNGAAGGALVLGFAQGGGGQFCPADGGAAEQAAAGDSFSGHGEAQGDIVGSPERCAYGGQDG